MRLWVIDCYPKSNSEGARQIFPSYSSARRAPTKNSVLAKIKEKRVLEKSARMNSSWALRVVDVYVGDEFMYIYDMKRTPWFLSLMIYLLGVCPSCLLKLNSAYAAGSKLRQKLDIVELVSLAIYIMPGYFSHLQHSYLSAPSPIMLIPCGKLLAVSYHACQTQKSDVPTSLAIKMVPLDCFTQITLHYRVGGW